MLLHGKDDAPKELSRCARTLLSVLASKGTASDGQISALSRRYRATSSTFQNAMTELRRAGYLEGPPEARRITNTGAAAAGPLERLPEGEELVAYWSRSLSKCAGSMLRALWNERPTMQRERLTAVTGYRLTSSTFQNALTELRKLELITSLKGGDITLADSFLV
jgi:hypothetical protein